jgi:hypothetical protein
MSHANRMSLLPSCSLLDLDKVLVVQDNLHLCSVAHPALIWTTFIHCQVLVLHAAIAILDHLDFIMPFERSSGQSGETTDPKGVHVAFNADHSTYMPRYLSLCDALIDFFTFVCPLPCGCFLFYLLLSII